MKQNIKRGLSMPFIDQLLFQMRSIESMCGDLTISIRRTAEKRKKIKCFYNFDLLKSMVNLSIYNFEHEHVGEDGDGDDITHKTDRKIIIE